MLEKILVVISMLGLIVFCGVVLGFVAEPDLIVVTLLILALASHDFWISVFKRKNGGPVLDTSGPSLESRPTGVSGKPASQPAAKEKPAAKKKPATKRKTTKK